ncbi:hypothetical protein Y032_0432g1354 [Ancylostoma ceylanicum]|uniref:Reverse transcriptase domain-containing protein n=1 Tax=Ancylostoma ceylanicum TaxID=53326 RepID=A0A016X068_9BILA|nr:hypothetical protein Y032_0432g1354 [Ancylostoma ceylanicum]
MTALRRPDGTTTSSRRVMEEVIYDFYSDLFDSHVHLPPCHLREDGNVITVLSSELRHSIKSVKNRTAPGPDRIRPDHLKNLPTALVNTLARLFTRYLSECKIPSQWETSRTVLLYKKGDPQGIGNYRPICLMCVGRAALAGVYPGDATFQIHRILFPFSFKTPLGAEFTSRLLEA